MTAQMEIAWVEDDHEGNKNTHIVNIYVCTYIFLLAIVASDFVLTQHC